MLLLSDNDTRYLDEYILKYWSDAREMLKDWKVLRQKDTGKQGMQCCTDSGGEYTSQIFAEYLKSHGIEKKTIIPDTPKSKAVVDWVNGTIME